MIIYVLLLTIFLPSGQVQVSAEQIDNPALCLLEGPGREAQYEKDHPGAHVYWDCLSATDNR